MMKYLISEIVMRSMKMKRIKNLLIIALIIICWVVIVTQISGRDTWYLIIGYWVVLLVKNVFDYMEVE